MKLTSKFSRLSKLGLAGLKAGSELTMGKIKSLDQDLSRLRATQELIKTVGEMKGGPMKVAQMLSITEDLVLPPEVTKLLKSLQHDAPPMPEPDLQKMFQKNFGKKPEEIFGEFNPIPFAAASIGQVHLAKLKSGEEVAVKVQYPNIKIAVENDLQSIDHLDYLIGLIYPKKPNVADMISELKRTLVLECDYQNEKREMIFFRELFLQEFSDSIYVPKVYEEFSTNEILVTEFIRADKFENTLRYSQDEKDYLGNLMYESFLYSFFNKQALHTDPQSGNFLFRKKQIIILDFGSTKHFSNDFVDNYAALCASIKLNDKNLLKKILVELNINCIEDTSEEFERSEKLIRAIYEPFLKHGSYPIENLNPFQFIKDYAFNTRIAGRKAAKEEFLLLDRANVGLFMKLRTWQARVDWEQGRKKYQTPRENKVLENLGKTDDVN